MTVKDRFKRISLLYALNVRWKAFFYKRRYASLRAYYQRKVREYGIVYNEEKVAGFVKQQLKFRNVKIETIPKGKLRIFWVGADYAQDSSGIIQGLRKFGEVILFEGSPGKYEQIWPKGADIKIAREENSRQLITQIDQASKRGPIHIVIGQMWPHVIAPEALQSIRDKGMVVVNIAMDDRHVFKGRKVNGVLSGTSRLIPVIDLACTAAKECCLWYQIEGCPSIYLPEASDPEFFKPLSISKLYDVCFVGANYGIRTEIVKAIEKQGIKVTCFGRGWPNGFIETKKIPELFAQSRIALGVGTIGHCTDFYSLKMRDFDGPMSGSLYLTHHNADLEELFIVGKELETYRTPEECAKKVRYYIDHQSEANVIGRAGRARAEKEHTWEKRFEKVFKTIGLLER